MQQAGAPPLSDPRAASVPGVIARAAPFLNDARDVAFVWVALQCAGVAALGVVLFFVSDRLLLWLAPVYWALLFGGLVDRFTLMLHCVSHRPLFRKRYRVLNQVIPTLLGPFFGQSPNTYFAHHLGMHHREENLERDLSSTMRFQRDRLDHWLRYYVRFMLFVLIELSAYFYARKQWKLLRRVLAGEFVYWSLIALLFSLRPLPTLVVLLTPFIVIRTLMMVGNWAQHAFVCAIAPENPYRASITCLNTRYNRRCFNDGYHVLHHVKPSCHWTEHPQEFERALAEYGRQDAIVFDGIDYFGIWWCLMFRRWSTLASRFVRLEGAPERTPEAVIELLRSRTRPVLAAPGLAVSVASPEA